MELTNKDLNLLVIFDKIWSERNLHRAAKQLYITQPALSHALKRLRVEFGDPLFVKSSRGVTPTDFACALASEVSAVLNKVEGLYETNRIFNSLQTKRNLSIAFGDYFTLTHLQQFLNQIHKAAPMLTLKCFNDSELINPARFELGEVHIGISGFMDLDLKQGFRSEVLVDDFINCVARKDHPLFSGRLTYSEAEHLFVSVHGARRGIVDSHLESMGQSRNVTTVAPSFFAAGVFLQSTNCVLTGPSRINSALAQRHDLKTFDFPFGQIPFPVRIYWHQRSDEDPLIKWVREILKNG